MEVHVEEPEQLQKLQARINWFGRIGGILISPKTTLQDIASYPDWVIPCLLLFTWPVVSVLMAIRSLGSTQFLFLAVTFIIPAVFWVIASDVIWFAGRASVGKAGFYPLLCVLGYAFFPAFVSRTLSNIAELVGMPLRMVSFLYLNLGTLLIKTDLMRWVLLNLQYRGGTKWALALSMVFQSTNIFSLWSYVLVFLGIRSVFGFEARKAVVFTFLYWIIYVAFQICESLLTNSLFWVLLTP
jgi:hypothetical protein